MCSHMCVRVCACVCVYRKNAYCNDRNYRSFPTEKSLGLVVKRHFSLFLLSSLFLSRMKYRFLRMLSQTKQIFCRGKGRHVAK